MIWKLYYKKLGGHIHCRLFCGPQEGARTLLKSHTYFDYLAGRVMKIDLSGDELDPRLYDRDLGQGAAERTIDALRRKTNAD